MARALVIDDSRTMRRLIGRMLQGMGFDVEEASHGREGLERLSEGDLPDFALVDWNMPEMDGFSFVKAVRADEGYRDVRLVMVTTETEMERVASALEAGADEYVMKPFTPDILRDKLEILGLVNA